MLAMECDMFEALPAVARDGMVEIDRVEAWGE